MNYDAGLATVFTLAYCEFYQEPVHVHLDSIAYGIRDVQESRTRLLSNNTYRSDMIFVYALLMNFSRLLVLYPAFLTLSRPS